MLWRKEATFNETFVAWSKSKFSVTIWGRPKGILPLFDEGVERHHIKIFDIGVFICLCMQLKGLASTAEKASLGCKGEGYF